MKKATLSALLLFLPLMSYAQQMFPSPDAAASAFASAVAEHNDAELTAILGDNWRQYLPPDGADPEVIARFNRDWKTAHTITQHDNVAHLNVGQQGWQLPIPIVKMEKGWQFDMAAAQDEILTRAIGRNELSAIGAMHAYVDAQEDYWQRKQHYASKLISSSGQQDGLYWPTQPGETPSPLGPAFSPTEPGEGYHGYHFRIIHSQQPDGFALIAWPVSYGETGVMSFMVGEDDRVYQAVLGNKTEEKAAKVSQFSPAKPWEPVE